ncbi:beta-L-arabinofuranosidase domain-containing protein [Bacteroides uniformis]|uniref:beta-L-arabinofuranosidase domain-containing protein n=2 Tax=Bacteroides uniformis TaxID=820 RepID=UPI001D086FAE|nr:beta-L-arabinofuranosidase domain-containing protein [Bacteroides uniformis]MCB6701148.1 glycoside hydrolase family 127 protein [Bacteroides uniformis]
MKIKIFAVVCLLAANLFTISAQKWFTPEAEKQVDALLSQVVEGNYKNNRYPLLRKPLMELPLGSIKPKGWLHEMLVRQKNGASGQMDVLYPSVMGKRNGWLGGDGDQWERGPYWIDGLLPLAYILDDDVLKAKVQPWIEWALQSQREDGFFGPEKDYPGEPGLQRDNSQDWWPRMVVLKILQQYYSATNDKRVVAFMTKYFRYQLNTLPQKPLGHWSSWAEFRACDNLQAVYWLYNLTGEDFLLELGHLLHRQSFSFIDMVDRGDLRRPCTIHCVNLAQGIKEPIIYYQQDTDRKYIDAVKEGFRDIRRFHGQPQGMYGGDEALHGNNPTQGSELCSAVELMYSLEKMVEITGATGIRNSTSLMYSLEKMVEITGDIDFADHLERIAFNALPAQISDDFMTKQYFQQPNQVMVTRHRRNFDQDHEGTDLAFGTLTGYPCCFSNMHQGWPKFTQHLWYATPDNGIAAIVYSPSEVTANVGDNVPVVISEDTYYPMDHQITFTIKEVRNKVKQVKFPFHLRVPKWCKQAEIRVNGKMEQTVKGGKIAIVDRIWKRNDKIELYLPMEVFTSTWYENAVSIERGPLVYALKMEENWEKKEFKDSWYGSYYYQVTSSDPWNYGLVDFDRNRMNEVAQVSINSQKQQLDFPWNQENAPVEIKMKARLIPTWTVYNEMAGPQPFSFCGSAEGGEQEITLIPYGCTTLRISEFPVVGK